MRFRINNVKVIGSKKKEGFLNKIICEQYGCVRKIKTDYIDEEYVQHLILTGEIVRLRCFMQEDGSLYVIDVEEQ